MNVVQCVDGNDDGLLRARALEGACVTVEGDIGTPCLSRTYLCFSIKSNTVLAKQEIKSPFDYLAERCIVSNGSSNEDEDESLLELPEGEPEKLVRLKGKLILRLFPALQNTLLSKEAIVQTIVGCSKRMMNLSKLQRQPQCLWHFKILNRSWNILTTARSIYRVVSMAVMRLIFIATMKAKRSRCKAIYFMPTQRIIMRPF